MCFAGTEPDPRAKYTSWEVPTSMRNVDVECLLEISRAYAQDDGEMEEE